MARERQNPHLHNENEATTNGRSWPTANTLSPSHVQPAARSAKNRYDVSPDSELDPEFYFRNNIQRCESYLSTLHTCLEIYKRNGYERMVALMAKKLESVTDSLDSAI